MNTLAQLLSPTHQGKFTATWQIDGYSPPYKHTATVATSQLTIHTHTHTHSVEQDEKEVLLRRQDWGENGDVWHHFKSC